LAEIDPHHARFASVRGDLSAVLSRQTIADQQRIWHGIDANHIEPINGGRHSAKLQDRSILLGRVDEVDSQIS
jgi:hypothetical protein